MNVRVGVSDTAVPVNVPVKLAAARELSERLDPEADEHQRHAEFQNLRQPRADLKMQKDHQDTRDKKRDRMADSPQPPDQRSAPDTFALADDGRNRRQVIGFGGVV